MKPNEIMLLQEGLTPDGKRLYTAEALKSALESFQGKLPMPIMASPGSKTETGLEIFSVRLGEGCLLGSIRRKV